MADYHIALPVTKAKRELTDLVKQLEECEEVIAITKNGFPRAALVNLDHYEGLLETIEILSDPQLRDSLQKAKQEIEQGMFLGEEEVWE